MRAPVASRRARARAALDTLRTAPWRRAPVLLLRRPGVVVATAGAAAVLAVAGASVPLFLSSAGTEAVALQAGERCPKDTGATSLVAAPTGSALDTPDPFAPLAARLGPSLQWGRMETWLEGAEPSSRTPVVVLFRVGAEAHLDVEDGATEPGGVWLSDRAAGMVRAAPGGSVELGGVGLPVAGVYRDLAAGTIADPYWCAHRTDLLLRGADLIPPRPVVLVDRVTWKDLERTGDVTAVSAAWEAPLRPGVTVGDARALVDDLACRGGQAGELTWCAADPTAGASEAEVDAFVKDAFESSLPFVVDRARAIQVAVGGGVWPVAVLAALAGAGLVGATALLWCDRRRRELELLAARGIGPVALGVKAVLELALALVAGTVAGTALAYVVVVAVGPSPHVEADAVVRAGWLAALALVVSAVLVLVVVAARTSSRSGGRRPRPWLRIVPWELALAVATLVSFRRLDAWGAPVSTGASVTRIDAVGLLFPVLFLTTVVAVAARALGVALGPVRVSSRAWSAPLFLAVARVSRYRTAVIGMVAASALAAGVFAYAATVQRSMDATLEAKALVYLGSDVVVRVPQDEPIPTELAGRATSVDLYQQAWVETPRRTPVNVFAIDPATFEDASFWDPSLASASLDEIVDGLAAPPTAGRVPVVAVGVDLPTVARAGIVTSGTTELEVSEVGDVTAFPGMRRGSPAMFVAASALDDLGLSTRVREVRIRGDRAEILRTLDRSGTSYQEITTAEHVVDAISFLTVAQTFGFLRSMALGSALLVVGGVAVYLDARRRSRVLAYAFARRMGLTSAAHRKALSIEVLAGIGTGCWLGVLAALGAAALVIGGIDPLPLARPDPLLRPAIVASAAVVVASVTIALAAAALAQRATDRDDPVEVLRGGT